MSGAPSAKAAAAAKAKKEKKILIVSTVVLLALLGFELPKMMGGSKAAEVPLTPAVIAPAVVGPDSASPLAANGALRDTDRLTVTVGSGQLIAFGLFKSKDPFVQQLSTNPTAPEPGSTNEPVGIPATTPSSQTTPAQSSSGTPASGGSGTPAGSGSSSGAVPANPATTPVTGATVTPVASPTASGSPTSTTSTQTSTTPAVAPTAVPISTNGVCENVSLNATFPTNEDIFKLVSIAKNGKSAKIGIVGGAYDSGQATTSLDEGVKTTLVNTADGTRYVIELVTKCTGSSASASSTGTSTAPGTAGGSGSTAPTGTVSAPTVPTATTTTPIVTDLLDTLSPVGK